MKTMQYDLSVVVPCYNEEKRIGETIKKIVEYFSKKRIEYELILFDDGSIDNTLGTIKEVVKDLQNELSGDRIKILRYTIDNRGKGFAVREGVLKAKGKHVLFSDADLSTPIEEVEKLIKWLNNGYNIAIGSRSLPESKVLVRQNKVRESMGKAFNILVRSFTQLPYCDTQCGFKCFDRLAVDAIFKHLKLEDFCFDVEILYLALKLKLKVKEVPVRWVNSPHSKVHIIRDSNKMILGLIKLKKMHTNSLSTDVQS